jgi:hypothetical protein
VSASDLISGGPTGVGRGRGWTDAPSNGHRGRACAGRPGLGRTEADPIERDEYRMPVYNGSVRTPSTAIGRWRGREYQPPRLHAATAAFMERGQRPPRGSAGLGQHLRVWYSPGSMFRAIAHLDKDGLFASVDHRDNPALPGRPAIIGAAPAQNGVVRGACLRRPGSAAPSPAFACTGRVLASSGGVVAE